MAYEKQNFEDGKVLTAAQLNAMDDQIEKSATLVVTWFDSGHRDRATHGAVQIFHHVESGGVVVFDDNGCYYTLQYVDEGQAIFFYPGDDHCHMLINIGMQGDVGEYEINTVSKENFNSAVGDIAIALDAIIAMQEELIGS